MGFSKTGSLSSVWICGLFICLTAVSTENSDIHSLTYIYTAFSSEPKQMPGIHKFSAVGQLDGNAIDYFDNDHAKKIPKQSWMTENLQDDYWSRGTETRKSKQQWFDVNIGILKERMRQNDSDTHILQWLHGCVAKRDNNGKLSFFHAHDKYSYDGQDFLYFDDASDSWHSTLDAAKETIRKWETVSTLKDYTKSYLETDCVNWMEKFLGYRQKCLEKAAPPEVVIYASKSPIETKVHLTCFATGLHLKEVELQMRRNGEIIDPKMGLESSGVRPNHDNTYQRKDFVEILRSDEAQFTCEVIHTPSRLHVMKVWDQALPSGSSNVPIILGVIGIILVGLAVGLIVLKIIGPPCKSGTNKGSSPSLSSSGTNKTADSTSDEGKNLMASQTKEPKTSLNGSDSGVSMLERNGENKDEDGCPDRVVSIA